MNVPMHECTSASVSALQAYLVWFGRRSAHTWYVLDGVPYTPSKIWMAFRAYLKHDKVERKKTIQHPEPF